MLQCSAITGIYISNWKNNINSIKATHKNDCITMLY